MSILTRRGQLAVANKATFGAFSGSLSVIGEVRDFAYDPQVEMTERQVASIYNGARPSIPGGKYGQCTFQVEIRGTGTPGQVPDIDPLLLAAGYERAINTGTAAVGALVKAPFTPGIGTAIPTLGGTFGHTASGRVVVRISEVVTDTSIDAEVWFFPAGGGAAVFYSITQSASTAVTFSGGPLDGVTIDFGDPSASTAGYVTGDAYAAPMTSADAVGVIYTPADNPTTYASPGGPLLLDLQYIEDGNRHRIANAAVTQLQISADRGGVAMATFTVVGEFVPEAGAASFEAGTANQTAPPTFRAATFTRNGSPIACPTQFSFDAGIVSGVIGCVTATEGFRGAEVLAHDPTFTSNERAQSFTTRNPYTDWYNFTLYSINLRIGSAGNGFAIRSDYAQSINVTPAVENEAARMYDTEIRFTNPNDGTPTHELEFF